MLIAIAAFSLGLIFAVSTYPDLLQALDFGVWLWVLFLVPFTFFANAVQFWITGRLIGIRVEPQKALQVAVVSAAANMLPIPGGSLVRMAALKDETNTYSQTALVTVFVAGCWLGVTLSIVSGALLWLKLYWIGAICAAVGIIAITLFGLLLLQKRIGVIHWLFSLLVTQTLLVLIGTLRFWLCFAAIGQPLEIAKATVLTLSSVIASFIGIAPGGLGITEWIAAGLSVIIGLIAASGFLAATLNRISNMIIIGPIALAIYAFESNAVNQISWGRDPDKKLNNHE